METVLFLTVWNLALKLLLPPLGAILMGAMVASFLRIWTQLDDISISFLGRVAGFVLFLMFAANGYFQPVVQFAQETWSKSAYYQ